MKENRLQLNEIFIIFKVEFIILLQFEDVF